MKRDGSWVIGRYAFDVHKHLLKKERKLSTYLQQSPQLSERLSLVEFIIEICNKMDFCSTVKHSAIYFLDIFMDNHVIIEEHLYLIAVGCIIVAVKVDSQNDLIPTMTDFNMLLENAYQLRELIETEASIMEFFKWDLLLPTPATFKEYYSLYVIRMNDIDGSFVNAYDMKAFAQKYIDFFLESTLKDCRFRLFRPSVVAASCIAVARRCLGLTSVWPYCLETLTNCKYTVMENCVDLMLQNVLIEEEEEMSSDQIQIQSETDEDESDEMSSENPEIHPALKPHFEVAV